VRPLLTLIVLLPLAGFLLNGIAGNRLGKRFVSVVGCGLPVLAFAAVVKCLIDLTAGGGVPRIEIAYGNHSGVIGAWRHVAALVAVWNRERGI